MIMKKKFFAGSCVGRMSCLTMVMALTVLFFHSRAFAETYYPYYPVYQPVRTLSPNGAALGPWRWNFNVGGGPTIVTGGSQNNLTNGSNFVIGGGFNFSPRVGLVLEFAQSGLGVTDGNLRQNQAWDANASVESVTLNPVWRYRIGGPVGGYIIGGGGFYHRDVSFLEPTQLFIPTSDGGFFINRNERIDQAEDTGGVNIGTGLTCNLGWGTKLFVEVRYHYIFTSGYATEILPITIGLRW